MKRTALTALTVIGLAAVTGCSKYAEPWNDAKIERKDDTPAEVYSMPDGFGNFATKCDRHGNRIYTLYHHDSPYGGITVAPNDPTCKR